MKKTNFFKLLTVGVAALSLGFASCNYAKEADFKALCDDVETLQNDVAGIKTQLEGLSYVVSVKETAANSGDWLVTDNKGGTVTIKTGSTPQDGEVRAGTLSVDPTTGNWFIGSTDTGVKANATMPRIGTEGDQKYWEFPVIEGNTVVWVRGAAAVAYTYAVNNNGQWSLWVPTKDNTSTLQEIKLPGASAGLGKIDILGWVDGYELKDGVASGNLATNPAGTYYNDDEDYQEDGDSKDPGSSSNGRHGSTEYDGTKLDPTTVAVRNMADDTFAVYYNWIPRFYTDTNKVSFNGTPEASPYAGRGDIAFATGAALPYYNGFNTGTAASGQIAGNNLTYDYPNIYTPGALKPEAYAWTSEKGMDGKQLGSIAVNRYDVVTTLDADNKGFVVQVHPLTADIKEMTFTLEDSKGNVLPVKFKKPVLISGLMTRGATNSALWFIEGEAGSGNFPTANGRVNFAKQFTTNTVWSLVTPDGVRSEYTPFTITPTYVLSRENQVDGINDGDKPAVWDNVPSHATGTPDKAYSIHRSNWISPVFEASVLRKADGTAIASAEEKYEAEISEQIPFDIDDPTENGWSDEVGYTTNSVVDWYIVVGSNTANEQWITDNFGLKYNDGHTAFQVTRIPDDLTRASFWMDLYKLGIDGTIYVERLPFHVVRDVEEVTIPVEYTIWDEWPAQPQDYLSQKFTVSLQPMFDKLATITDGPSTMKDRWQDETYGAHYFTVESLEIEGLTGNQIGRFMFPNLVTKTLVGADGVPTSATITTPTGTTGVVGADASPALPAIANTVNTLGQHANNFGATAMGLTLKGAANQPFEGLFDATSLEFYPNYAYNTGGATPTDMPSFVRNKKHTFTVHFYDVDGYYLNTIKIEVTPEIPVLNNLFKKDLNRWDSETDPKVLYAYYDIPVVPWRETKFYGTDVLTADNDWITNTLAADGTTIGYYALGATTNDYEVRRNSTFYNVFNPGGTTTMKHSQYRPLDGGYLKVGNKSDAQNPKQWIDETAVELKDPNATFEGSKKYGDVMGTHAAYAAGLGGLQSNLINQYNGTDYNNTTKPFTSHTIVQLFGQTNSNNPLAVPETSIYNNTLPKSGTAYNKEVPMTWYIGKYLHYYVYEESEKDGEDFSIRVMSAIDKDAVGVAGLFPGEPVENMGGVLTRINSTHIYMKDYAGIRREVFKDWVAGPTAASAKIVGYAYNYIAQVWFSRPAEVTDYDIYDEDGQIINTGSTAIDPTPIVDGKYEVSYLPIMTKLVEGAKKTAIHVKVYDRFGRTLEGDVPFDIVDNERN